MPTWNKIIPFITCKTRKTQRFLCTETNPLLWLGSWLIGFFASNKKSDQPASRLLIGFLRGSVVAELKQRKKENVENLC